MGAAPGGRKPFKNWVTLNAVEVSKSKGGMLAAALELYFATE
ncbi:hypothetical protein FOXB_08612 [Fusarium oxysporum f. sp. conglutinans Fo5176]|uniref:Uncharacterized protein n=1 Tax=Fusarium oxysporum (strain Fo5176) TaxID=660025 RepID=F9FQD2_FUSOF|nr:hypothetical protein FOXB_08612 [Fusarium oxysporum f. sp. conglutinans Fo5176]